ncbi:hypothetical protein BDY19DRAFT_908775 [Irpex rosettiformis]|uniref:Uncharacterized protein n=1 Tax=Irpex rosettiformis TaxID=378272 RepID=A0ACB8TUM4_9APHY|nr:hypothetical protein BDY19DRAFT_908775 [Irpex rosettiformis]
MGKFMVEDHHLKISEGSTIVAMSSPATFGSRFYRCWRLDEANPSIAFSHTPVLEAIQWYYVSVDHNDWTLACGFGAGHLVGNSAQIESSAISRSIVIRGRSSHNTVAIQVLEKAHAIVATESNADSLKYLAYLNLPPPCVPLCLFGNEATLEMVRTCLMVRPAVKTAYPVIKASLLRSYVENRHVLFDPFGCFYSGPLCQFQEPSSF